MNIQDKNLYSSFLFSFNFVVHVHVHMYIVHVQLINYAGIEFEMFTF